jgi:hypothetical protein
MLGRCNCDDEEIGVFDACLLKSIDADVCGSRVDEKLQGTVLVFFPGSCQHL